LTTQEAVESDTGGFDASDFGIGAGVALAFVLLLGAVAVGFNVVHVGTRRERAT